MGAIAQNSQLTGDALTMAFESRGRAANVMFHSDQGCHYTSRQFRQLIGRYQIKQNMSRRSNCWESLAHEVLWVQCTNGKIFRSLK